MKRLGWAGILMVALSVGGFGCDANRDDKPLPPQHTYANPISLPDEWGEYGLGDPFVFSYNGYYYLYVSTRDTDPGVKVWRSDNLIDWTYEGLCADDPITTAAYAPEVRYWNGKFYMYTSPAGQGHYVLVGDRPTGPFEVATDNFGRTIDGSTFVDDDGKWYFYYAGTQGIQAAPMPDPLTVGPEEIQTGAYMGGWTEGATVFKRNGKYYMTYTGNHVFSSGYRVDVAVSDNPLRGFAEQANNPALLRSEGATVGLGHNSVVTGPDLDTQYIVYHNLEGHGVVGPLRHMNLDRIVWNGDRLRVAGPTSDSQPVPAMPVFSDRFEGDSVDKSWKREGKAEWTAKPGEGLLADATGGEGLSMLLSDARTGADYTAEFHVQHLSGEIGRSGVVFSYGDDDHYGLVQWKAETREIEARFVQDGQAVPFDGATARIPENLDIGELQKLRLEVKGNMVRVYAEGMRLLTMTLPGEAGEGRIGYAVEGAQARYGYVAFSNLVDGSGANAAYAPIPGIVDAIHNEKGPAAGYSLAEDGNGGFAAAHLGKGSPLTYVVNVAKGGEYSLRFRLNAGAAGAKFRLLEDGSAVAGSVEVKSDPAAGAWQTVVVNGVKLSEGVHRWTIEIEKGEMALSWIEAAVYVPVEARTDEFDTKLISGWTRYEGDWSVKDGELRSSSTTNGKLATGEDGWTDYEVQADVSVPEPGGQSGIAVRVTEPANGMELNQNRDDFLRGYYAYVDERGVHLVKHDYNTVPLADKEMAMPAAGETLKLKIRAVGNRISVFVDEAQEPAIEYADVSERTFLNGRIALKTVAAAGRFDHVRIEPILHR